MHVGVMDSPELTVIENACVAVRFNESVTCTVKLYVAGELVHGPEPEITPAVERVRPHGSGEPLIIDHE